jgi:uncharacterized membrane protein required for colicin V production
MEGVMLRKILGFALLAFVALVVLKIALGLLGVLFGLAISVLVFACLGYGLYLILRVVSPATAAKARETIRGRPAGVQ